MEQCCVSIFKSSVSVSRTFGSCSLMHAHCAHAGVPSPFALRVFLYCGFALYSRIASFDHHSSIKTDNVHQATHLTHFKD